MQKYLARSDNLSEPVRVRPLPWPMVEALNTMLRKLAHDLTNSMVAGLSMVDLLQMKTQDEQIVASLGRLRAQMLRPRDTLQAALTPLPHGSGERPRTLVALHRWLQQATEQAHVSLVNGLPTTDAPDRRPQGLAEAEWVHLIQLLVQNALDAHAAQQLDRDGDAEGELPWVRIELVRDGGLLLAIRDNGPGCADLQAVAQGTQRRAGQGHLGLGLPIAAAIAARAGGTLEIASRKPHGLVAAVVVP